MTVALKNFDSHAARLPFFWERLQLPEDDPNPRLPDLLREEVRLRPADYGELQRRVELRLNFGLERQDGRDNVRAARFDDQRDFSLYPPRQI